MICRRGGRYANLLCATRSAPRHWPGHNRLFIAARAAGRNGRPASGCWPGSIRDMQKGAVLPSRPHCAVRCKARQSQFRRPRHSPPGPSQTRPPPQHWRLAGPLQPVALEEQGCDRPLFSAGAGCHPVFKTLESVLVTFEVEARNCTNHNKCQFDSENCSTL